jgi:hypothetical protein
MTQLDAEDRERLLAQPDDLVHFAAGKWPRNLALSGVIRVLRHGDEVIVRGLVQRNFGDGGPGASYRPMSSAFELVPLAGEDHIEVAHATVGRVVFGKPALVGRGLAVGVALALFVAGVVGVSARRVQDFATAALFQPHRAWALDELARDAADGPAGEAQLGLIMAYHDRAPDCRRTGEALLAHGRWMEAGDMLASCDDDLARRAALAYQMAGALPRACEVLGGTGDLKVEDAVFLLLGGCGPQAAPVLRRASDSLPKDRATTLRCLADGIDGRGGDREAVKRLASQGSEPCRLVHADLLEGKARLEALSVLSEAPASEKARHEHPLVIRLLLTVEGYDPSSVVLPPLPTALQSLSNPGALVRGRALGLEQEALAKLAGVDSPTSSQRSLRRLLAARMAGFEIVAGRLDEAQSLLDRAAADTGTAPPSTQGAADSVEELRADAQIVSLRVLGHVIAGNLDKARAALEPWNDLTPSRFLGDFPPSSDLPSLLATIRSDVVRPIDDAAALVAATRGRTHLDKPLAPSTLAALVAGPSRSTGQDDVDFRQGPNLLAAARGRVSGLPLLVTKLGEVTEKRELLVDWLAYDAREASSSPSVLLWEAALAARAAMALGEKEVSARHGAAAGAYRDALMQRHAALTLALLPLD